MNKDAFIQGALDGKPLVLVEYRSFKEETLRYRDKKTGQAVERLVIKHAVEMGGNQVQVGEWLPDTAKPGQAQPPFKKGSVCVLQFEGFEREQGFYRATGQLFPYEAK